MYQLKSEIEHFEDFPVVGEDYVIGRLYGGDYYVAYGSDYPFRKRFPYSNQVDETGGVIYFKKISDMIDTAIRDMYAMEKIYDINETTIVENVERLKNYEAVFGNGLRVDLENEEEIMEDVYAEIGWGLKHGTVKRNKDKFPPGTIREVGFKNELYLVTKQGMDYVFGSEYKSNSENKIS